MRSVFCALLLLLPLHVRGQGSDVGPCVPCDTLFAATGGSDGQLFTIDPESGSLDVRGEVSSYSDIALTPDGRLYGLGQLSDNCRRL